MREGEKTLRRRGSLKVGAGLYPVAREVALHAWHVGRAPWYLVVLVSARQAGGDTGDAVLTRRDVSSFEEGQALWVGISGRDSGQF